MEAFLNPAIFIPILIFTLAAIVYLIYSFLQTENTRKGGTPGRATTPNSIAHSPIYAFIADNTNRVTPKCYEASLNGDDLEKILDKNDDMGIELTLPSGKRGFLLTKNVVDLGVEYHLPPEIPLSKDSPIGLNSDTFHFALENLYKIITTVEGSFLQKYGQALWWAAVIAFIIFMMVSSK